MRTEPGGTHLQVLGRTKGAAKLANGSKPETCLMLPLVCIVSPRVMRMLCADVIWFVRCGANCMCAAHLSLSICCVCMSFKYEASPISIVLMTGIAGKWVLPERLEDVYRQAAGVRYVMIYGSNRYAELAALIDPQDFSASAALSEGGDVASSLLAEDSKFRILLALQVPCYARVLYCPVHRTRRFVLSGTQNEARVVLTTRERTVL